MNELDLLKKDWKRKENSFNQLSEKDIYAMLHKKSSSIVKWILIISIIEVLVWIGLNFLSTADEYLKEINHPEIIGYFQVLTYFHYGVTLVFIYLFYKNYRSISTTLSTKNLMSSILSTRKTVNFYVYYNLGMMLISLIIGFVIAIVCNPKVEQLRDKISQDGLAMFIVVALLFVFAAVFIGLFWLFYRLLYGILLRKLLANYKELKKIDF